MLRRWHSLAGQPFDYHRRTRATISASSWAFLVTCGTMGSARSKLPLSPTSSLPMVDTHICIVGHRDSSSYNGVREIVSSDVHP